MIINQRTKVTGQFHNINIKKKRKKGKLKVYSLNVK